LITPVLLRFAFPGRPIESTVDSLGVVEIGDVDAMSSRLDSLADAKGFALDTHTGPA